MKISRLKIILRIIASILLLFNGIGAVFGGYHFIKDPTGESLGMNIRYLDNSPFNNFLIPGTILFTCNGVLSFIVLLYVVFNQQKQGFLILLQGIVLTGWILVQLLMLQIVYFLHFIMGATGIGLVIIGYLLYKGLPKE